MIKKAAVVWALYSRFEQDLTDLVMSTVEVAFLWFADCLFSSPLRISGHLAVSSRPPKMSPSDAKLLEPHVHFH